MKKMLVTAIAAFAVIAAIVGCQVYDSQTNQVLASGMNRDGLNTFKLEDLTADFNKLCANLIDNSSDMDSYDAIVNIYMGFDKFRTAATAFVARKIAAISKKVATQEQKNAYLHDDEYIYDNYKEKYMTNILLYNTIYKYASDDYDMVYGGKRQVDGGPPTKPTKPTEPEKYTKGNTKDIPKPIAPTVPSLVWDLTPDTLNDVSNDAAKTAYQLAYAAYLDDRADYEASKEYKSYETALNNYNNVTYPKYLADWKVYNVDKRWEYIDNFSDFTKVPIIANSYSKDDSKFTLADLYEDANKLNWDYNSKK